MATPLLFDLNPDQYSLGRGTGKFRAVGQLPQITGMDELISSLTSLVKPEEFTLQAPVIPDLEKPVAPTNVQIPQFTGTAPTYSFTTDQYNQVVNNYKAASDAMKSTLESMAGPKNPARDVWQAFERDWERGYRPFTKEEPWYQGQPKSYFWQLGTSGTATAQKQAYLDYKNAQAAFSGLANEAQSKQPQVDAYNASLQQFMSQIDAYNQQMAPYKAQVDEYNAAIAPVRDEINRYNTAVQEYKTQAEEYNKGRNTLLNDFYSTFQNREALAAGEISPEGETLAATDLYSDALHQNMIQRISQTNSMKAG